LLPGQRKEGAGVHVGIRLAQVVDSRFQILPDLGPLNPGGPLLGVGVPEGR
jgi:hypothetical protein